MWVLQRNEVIEENHYYPFGLTLNTPPAPANANEHSKYQLTTKELQSDEFVDAFGKKPFYDQQ